MSDRLTEMAARELERAVTDRVEEMLAFLPTLPEDVEEVSIPDIDVTFDPRHPHIHGAAMRWVIKALAARYLGLAATPRSAAVALVR